MFWNKKPKSLGYFKDNYIHAYEETYGDTKGYSYFYCMVFLKAAYKIDVGGENSEFSDIRSFVKEAVRRESRAILTKLKQSNKDRFHLTWKLIALRRVRRELRNLGE